MVVMIVMALMSGLVVVSMGPALRESRLRSGCRIVAATLNYARSYAATQRTNTSVYFDKEKNGLGVQAQRADSRGSQEMVEVTTPSGSFRRLPQGVQITKVAKPGVSQEEDWVEFDDLGRSEAAVITIEYTNGKSRNVVVDAVTGRCAIEKSGTR
jgi:Tfp pilus assembly protein FimT